MKNTTKYLTGSVGGLIGLVVFFYFSSHFSTQLEGNVACAGTYGNICEWHYNVTLNSSVYNPFYIYNKGVDLNFVPDMKEVWHCKKDGTYKALWRSNRELAPCGLGYREFNWSTPLTKKYAYIEKFEKGDKHEYKIVALKFHPSDEIKFGGKITGNEFDPKFLADFIVIKDCKTTTETITRQIYDTEIVFNQNSTFCSDFPKNKSCKQISLGNFTRKFSIGTYIDFINTTTCEDIGFDFNNKKFYWKDNWKKCTVINSQIMCEAFHQSNGNGICESGEGCPYIDYNGDEVKSTISKTNTIKEYSKEMLK